MIPSLGRTVGANVAGLTRYDGFHTSLERLIRRERAAPPLGPGLAMDKPVGEKAITTTNAACRSWKA
jgi:hypothetical protein